MAETVGVIRRHEIGKLNGYGGRLLPRLYVSHAKRTYERTLCGITIGTRYNGWVDAEPTEFVHCQRCRKILDRQQKSPTTKEEVPQQNG